MRLSSEHVEHAWVQPSDLDGRSYSRAIKEQLEAFVALKADETAG